jgi:hypothetical protein
VTPLDRSNIPDARALLAHRRRVERLFEGLGLLATLVGIVVLAILVLDVLVDGWPRLGWQFLPRSHRAGRRRPHPRRSSARSGSSC